MRFVVRRLGFFLVTLWAAVTLNFLIPRLMPGNAAIAMMSRYKGHVNPQAMHALEIAFGNRDLRVRCRDATLVAIEQRDVDADLQLSFETFALAHERKRRRFKTVVAVAKSATNKQIGNAFGAFAHHHRARAFDTCFREAQIRTLL